MYKKQRQKCCVVKEGTAVILTVLLMVATPIVWGQTTERYLNEGQQLYAQRDLQGALRALQKGLALARAKHDRSVEGEFLFSLGAVYADSLKLREAELSYEQALLVARDLKNKALEMRILNGLGNTYSFQGYLDQAQTFYEQALRLARERKDQAWEAKILKNLQAAKQPFREPSKQSLDSDVDQYSPITPELRAYFNQGQECYKGSDLQGAREAFQQGLVLARAKNKRLAEGIFLNNLGSVSNELKDYLQAQAFYEQALEIAQKIPDKNLEVQVLNGLGNVHKAVGKDQEAQEFHEHAREKGQQAIRELQKTDQVMQDSMDRITQEMMRISQATDEVVAEKGLVNPTLELPFYQRQLEEARKRKDTPRELAALNSLGSVHEKLGNYSQAVSFYNQVLQLAEKRKNRTWELHSLNNVSGIYGKLGNYSQALETGHKALRIAREIKIPDSEAIALGNLGSYYAKSEDYPRALDYTQQALQIARKIGDTTEVEVLEGNVGAIYLALGRRSEAYEIFKRQGDSIRLGRYYLLNGQYQQARNEFEKDRIIAKSIEGHSNPVLMNTELPGYHRDVEETLALRIGTGQALEGLKNYADAKAQYQQAVDLIEQQRNGLTETQRQYFFAAKVLGFSRLDPYEGLVRVSLYLQDTAEGFFWAENTRARLLLEAVARRAPENRLGLPADLARQEADIVNRLALFTKQQDIASMPEFNEGSKALSQELAQLKQARDTLVARFRKEYPAYAALRYPPSLHVTDLKLKSDEVLVEYAITETATFAWLIKGQRILKSLTIPITRKDLDAKITQYREFFDFQGTPTHSDFARFDPKIGKELYTLLFKDFEPFLEEGNSLIIVPDGILGSLPFDALVVEVSAKMENGSGRYGLYPQGVRYLGDRYSISYAQSATAVTLARTLKRKQPAQKENVLVVTDPVFALTDERVAAQRERFAKRDDKQSELMSTVGEFVKGPVTFPRLEETGRLLERLQHLYGGGVDSLSGLAASETELRKRRLEKYGTLVFATHGVLADKVMGLLEPALVLNLVGVNPTEKEQDGFLTMTEVMGLSLNADLAALIACDTGRGKILTGEGVMGMGRAFQYAGASSVLMSLWSVGEEATVLMTERFFHHVHAGEDKVAALRLARAEVRQKGYEHPYYWASFLIMGNDSSGAANSSPPPSIAETPANG